MPGGGVPNFTGLVDDRLGDGLFRVDRAVYMDEVVFEAEMRAIFEGTWVYLAHESRIPNPGDYFSTWIGRRPVIVDRRADGSVGGPIDAFRIRSRDSYASLPPARHSR